MPTPSPVSLGDLLPESVLAGDDGETAPAQVCQAIEVRVAEVIARAWRVSPDNLKMRWGGARGAADLPADTEFRVVGNGLDGWFAVVFECLNRPAFAARIRVGVVEQVPVAARGLQPGQTLTAQDIAFESVVRWSPPPAVQEARAEPGWHVRRFIAWGEAIVGPSAVPAPVVHKGERVKLTWKRGVVTVAMDGVALHDAPSGHLVNVRLKGDRGMSRGIVTGPGHASLSA
jgi:flagella basal body P-ring formation protein FlgA